MPSLHVLGGEHAVLPLVGGLHFCTGKDVRLRLPVQGVAEQPLQREWGARYTCGYRSGSRAHCSKTNMDVSQGRAAKCLIMGAHRHFLICVAEMESVLAAKGYTFMVSRWVL